jgi:ABC-type phosphate transport system auxiliary subunit
MVAQSLPLILTLLPLGAGIFFNNRGLSDLRTDLKADMKDLKSELKADIAASESRLEARIDRLEVRLDARLNVIDSELLHFAELKGHLEGRIDEIAKFAKLNAERIAA